LTAREQGLLNPETENLDCSIKVGADNFVPDEAEKHADNGGTAVCRRSEGRLEGQRRDCPPPSAAGIFDLRKEQPEYSGKQFP